MAAMWMSILAFSATAQTTQLATLQHQDQVSIFYGAESLKRAVAAASDGDVITLSAGQFDAPTIDKELTIRGSGMGIINAPGYSIPTIINGTITATKKLNIEAVDIDELKVIKDITIVKSNVDNLTKSTTNYAGNVTIIQSRLHIGDLYRGSITGINSRITNSFTDSRYFKSANLINCVLHYKNLVYPEYIYQLTLTNCIIRNTDPDASIDLHNSVAAYNCILCGKIGTEAVTLDSTNLIRKDITTVFKEEGFYELQDEFKSFATTDGTEVGIYGGNLGFTQTPNNPQITKFTVAPRTSADGKLSVEIQVEGME